ncbi:MAG: hypothetical protein QHH06_11005 [Clostridiales bacterium]|nr:hypothetical protein [Eubacteriales bacterium]MDH7566991.1 hypothetical protein [Clostridiales bacterium]
MAEFCTCGSIIIDGHCTNKNCTFKAAAKSSAPKPASRKQASPEKKEAKPARTKRASKCITYNLYEIKEEEREGNVM